MDHKFPIITKRRQCGVALLSVLMLLVLLSTMAIYSAEEQNLSIRRVSNLREAEQAFQIATGGEQWAVKLLENDMINDLGQPAHDFDHASEDWANLGGAVKVEGTESFMQVTIFDEQGKFNLNNLIQERKPANNNPGNQPQPMWYDIFQRLLLGLKLDPLLVDVVIDWIDSDNDTTGTTGAEDPFYGSLSTPYRSANRQFSSVSELRQLRGFNSTIINKLSPFVTALPLQSASSFTRINVNTAPARILDMLSDEVGFSHELYLSILEYRAENPFQSVGDFINAHISNVPVSLISGVEPFLDVKSDYFVSRSCAETGKVHLSQISLLRKNREKENVTVHYRQSNHGCPKLQSQVAKPAEAQSQNQSES